MSDNTPLDLLESLNLNCPVCLSTYTGTTPPRIPMILQCGHTTCRECVDAIIRENSWNPKCPMCRDAISLAKPIKRNITVCEIVDALLANPKDKKKPVEDSKAKDRVVAPPPPQQQQAPKPVEYIDVDMEDNSQPPWDVDAIVAEAVQTVQRTGALFIQFQKLAQMFTGCDDLEFLNLQDCIILVPIMEKFHAQFMQVYNSDVPLFSMDVDFLEDLKGCMEEVPRQDRPNVLLHTVNRLMFPDADSVDMSSDDDDMQEDSWLDEEEEAHTDYTASEDDGVTTSNNQEEDPAGAIATTTTTTTDHIQVQVQEDDANDNNQNNEQQPLPLPLPQPQPSPSSKKCRKRTTRSRLGVALRRYGKERKLPMNQMDWTIAAVEACNQGLLSIWASRVVPHLRGKFDDKYRLVRYSGPNGRMGHESLVSLAVYLSGLLLLLSVPHNREVHPGSDFDRSHRGTQTRRRYGLSCSTQSGILQGRQLFRVVCVMCVHYTTHHAAAT